jgi:hypothetical protein
MVIGVVVADHLLAEHALEQLAHVGVLGEEAERGVDDARLLEVVLLHLLGEAAGDRGARLDQDRDRAEEAEAADALGDREEAVHRVLLLGRRGSALGAAGDVGLASAADDRAAVAVGADLDLAAVARGGAAGGDREHDSGDEGLLHDGTRTTTA